MRITGGLADAMGLLSFLMQTVRAAVDEIKTARWLYEPTGRYASNKD